MLSSYFFFYNVRASTLSNPPHEHKRLHRRKRPKKYEMATLLHVASEHAVHRGS